MQDTRQPLPWGTRLRLLSTGSIFEISGEPIGFGGGGIIYPARRMILLDGELRADGINYALKECYPASDGQDYYRSETGEILARNPEYRTNLENARKRHTAEKERNQSIHVTANRILPILEAADSVELTQPGKSPVHVSNAVSIMESLENKGRSLNDCLAERRRFSALETCRILQQLLFALREVHNAGYLHLDLQGGNVFLRGTLEDRSDFLTLIDFGSARPIGEDGRTEEIQDREIFTSQGFSAPEMLLKKTGPLQLSKESDLYSVGCIALLLLTGQRPVQSRLLVNRTGEYLKPHQMRRIDCPVHLQGQLQALLATALAKRPEDRFHSADEMLKRVNELLEALKPARTVLSTIKYDAFICYRHGADSPVAKALQRRLEHFRTTDNAGKRIKPFRKVFLDEGELSATANFGQTIRDALGNSRWLLVVCSENTPLSPWVKLEIETFLEIHGAAARSRILTVLTSGEPDVSFPPILLDQGTGGTEPYAVDIRGETLRAILKNLKGDPFLRLASAMLDRPFDALKQREKIYVLQRIAAIAGMCLLVTAAFAAYAVNRSHLIAAQSVRIQEEYENALINESMLLAEQADKLFKNNKPLEAMALALKALPSPEQDRPVVTEAEYVLGKTLGIYTSPNAAENTVTAVGAIDTDDDGFFLDDTGTYLFTWKRYGKGVRVWDAETLMPVRELLPQEEICHTGEELLIPEQNSLIFRTFGRIFSVNYLTGEQNWSFDAENIWAVCLSEDKTKAVLLTEQEKETGEKMPQLDILSAQTGAYERGIPFGVDPDYEVGTSLVLSPDMKWAAVLAVNPNSLCLHLIGLEDGNCRKILDTETEIAAMCFAEDRLAILRSSGRSINIKRGNVVYQYTEPIRAEIETYDPESGTLIWCSEQRYYIREDGIDELKAVPYDSGTVTGKGLLALGSDSCVLLDWDTGQVVREYELPSSALYIRYGSNGFETLNADGSSTAAGYTIDTLENIQYFDDSISAICRYQDSFYVQSTPVFSKDYSILKYKLGKYDETYTKLFEADISYTGYYDCSRTGSGVRLVTADDNQVSYMDSADGTALTYEIPDKYGFSAYRIVGSSPDAHRIYWCADTWDNEAFWITSHDLWVTDVLTGESRQVPVPAKPEEYMVVDDYLYFEESLLFTARISRKGGYDLGIYRWDLADGLLEKLYRYVLASAENPEDEVEKYYWEDYQYQSLQLDKEAKQISFATYTGGLDSPRNLIRLNLSGEETARISLDFAPEANEDDLLQWEQYCYQWSTDGTRAVIGYGEYVYMIGAEGDLIFRAPAAGYYPVARFLPDGESLLVLTEDLVLSQYRISDGACLTSINLRDYKDTTVKSADAVELIGIDETTAALFNGYDGFLLDTSGENVKIKAVLDQCVAYDAETDCFLAAESRSYYGRPAAVGTFRRYSLEELIQKANAILDKQA